MAIIKPPVLPPWADTAANPADIVQPTNLEIAAGWPQSATPPSRQRFNWILNFCANAVRYFSRRGLVDYDAAETYGVDDLVRGDDNGKIYRSLLAANINHLPSTSPTWWDTPLTKTAGAGDNTTRIATTAWVTTAITGKANTTGNYASMTVGNATNAAVAAVAASAGTVPWSGVTGRPTTVAGYGITDAITTGNIGQQSVTFATTAGRARPRRIDNVNWDLSYSGQAGQPNWLVGTNDGILYQVYNPANFSVNHATSADDSVTRALGSSGLQIATTAFVNPGSLISTSGFTRLPSGLIMQWGRISVGDIPGNPSLDTGTVAFALAFPTAVLTMQLTVADGSDAVIGSIKSMSATQFSWSIREIVGNVQAATLHWFAIGN